ncbi:MAG: phosphate signaling complex protein PhoU [Synergistaceae bacterium]|jgi:phosphate transport system protein|nr:phosphate signaling complex protein PhoU [Synergistaceae bacterium]
MNKSVEEYLYFSDREHIVELVLKMGGMVATALSDAVSAAEMSDAALATRVVEHDDDVDALEREIDLECLRAIAILSPVREELRFLFAVLKNIVDLERVGDEAVNIAHWALELTKYPKVPTNSAIVDMKDIAESMLRDSLSAFKTLDGGASGEICRRDFQLDRLYADVFNEFLEMMARTGDRSIQTIRALAGQMWIARHLERAGDHIVNIAERVYFADKGETPPKAPSRHSVPVMPE